MVLAIEPGIYWQGGGGLRVEDNFLITADGAEKLSPFPDGIVATYEHRPRQDLDGSINQQALEPQPRHTVGLYDTTLRDGEQSVGVVLMPEEKLEIARALDAAGIDRIEAGFPRVSDDDWRAVELIAGAGLRGGGLGVLPRGAGGRRGARRARRPGVGDREPDLGRQARRRSASRATRCSSGSGTPSRSRRQHGIRRVLRCRLVARRAGVLPSGLRAAVEAGAKEVVVVDTIGIATPEAAALLVGEAVDLLGHDVPGALARARRLRARDGRRGGGRAGRRDLGAGHDQRHGGAGGNADLIEVALALEALYGIPTRLDLTQARELSKLVQERAGTPLAPWKAVTGENLFVRESAPSPPSSTIRPRSSRMRPSSSGRSGGSCSGRRAASTRSGSRSSELGLDVPEERCAGAPRARSSASAPRSAVSSPTTSSGGSRPASPCTASRCRFRGTGWPTASIRVRRLEDGRRRADARSA